MAQVSRTELRVAIATVADLVPPEADADDWRSGRFTMVSRPDLANRCFYAGN